MFSFCVDVFFFEPVADVSRSWPFSLSQRSRCPFVIKACPTLYMYPVRLFFPSCLGALLLDLQHGERSTPFHFPSAIDSPSIDPLPPPLLGLFSFCVNLSFSSMFTKLLHCNRFLTCTVRGDDAFPSAATSAVLPINYSQRIRPFL